MVLEVTAASSFRRKDIENGGSMFRLDDGNFLPDCIHIEDFTVGSNYIGEHRVAVHRTGMCSVCKYLCCQLSSVQKIGCTTVSGHKHH